MPKTIQQETKKQTFKRAAIFALKSILFILVTFMVTYIFIHSPAWVNKINHALNKEEAFQALQPGIEDDNIIENTIIIPQANIYVPILETNSLDNNELEEKMQSGLALFQSDNKILVTGHYSEYFWKQGEYKYLLSTLGNLDSGDKIGLNLKNQYNEYQVREIKTIKVKEYSELTNIDADLIIASHWPPSLKSQKLALLADKIE